MKNYMKKITIAVFALAFLLVANSAHASWNTDSQDCIGSAIGNHTTQVGVPGSSSNCWNLTSVSANQGETINVEQYYDNTGTSTAYNTKISMTVSPALGQVASTHTFHSTLTSSAGSVDLGTVTVNLSTPQALTFGSTYAYPNQTTSPSILGGSDIISGGVNVGTVSAGWAGQGSLVSSFTVASNVIQQNCTITNFSASPTYVYQGGSSTLSWNTNNCTGVSLSSNTGSSTSSTSGSVVVYPQSTQTYTLSAYGNGGTQSQSVVVSVNNVIQNNCLISYFTASPTSINSGSSSTLSWNTSNCNSVSISNLNYNVPVYGSQVVYPTYTTTYVLTAYGNGGTQTQSVTVYVNNYPQNNCLITSFYASPTSINSGSSSTLSWGTSNCTSVSISNLNYSTSTYGSQVVYPTHTTTYVLNAYGVNGGQQSQSVTVFVNTAPPVTSCAVSGVATNITQTSATLNGVLTNSGNYNTYFEYGGDQYLGSQTDSRSSNGSTIFSDSISDLDAGTIYYYRLVSTCANGTIGKGDMRVFQTLKANVRPIIIQGKTIIGATSPIMLKIEDRYQNIKVGDTVDYIVTYKNIGTKTLTHPMVQVVLPDGISYVNSSRGTYAENSKTLSVPIDDLKSLDEGTIYVQGRVDSIQSPNAQIVTTALLIYTSDNQTQENAMAYVLNNPNNNNNNLSAAAFFSGFWGLGLIGWLLIIIIILLIILIYRRYFSRTYVAPVDSHTDSAHH